MGRILRTEIIMAWKGKALGAAAGSAFGPIGAAFGAWVGDQFDQDSDAKNAEQQQDYNNRLSIFAFGVCAAYSNGVMHPNQRKRLNIYAREIFGQITDGNIDNLIRDVLRYQFGITDCARVFAAMDNDVQPILACEILSILYADDSRDEWEYRWLNQVIQQSGSNPRDWDEMSRFFDRGTESGNTRAECLNALGLSSEADADAIKAAYRNQAREYHPDKLANVPEPVKKLAEDKLRALNVAYESLTKNTALTHDLSGYAVQISPTNTQGGEYMRAGVVTFCFLCGQKNRLPKPETMLKARCGVCYALLLLPKQMVVN
jgi:DnaJ-domain-containing protein 1